MCDTYFGEVKKLFWWSSKVTLAAGYKDIVDAFTKTN